MKKKKSKGKSSESVHVKPQAKKLNPFEVHINRKKYDVLGMKSKAERGLPGISRSKSLKKRKGTLLQEYKLKDKKNMFLDRRIGERNSAMTAEDKILARYTAQRMKMHSKKSIYNLGDDEELTHRGQTLTEIEKFDDPKSEDEDEEEGDGKLDSNFVEDAHFGGGIFKKVEGESKSRKSLIDQLIAESIKRKAEKQKMRQQTLDLTEKLDSEWKELLPLVTASKKTKLDSEPENKSDDKFANYDILSKKLKFETRGKPSDRLKSEEEIAKEEKEKLEQLESERRQRMLGESNVKTIKHRSADDIDDGFDLGNEPQTFLSYKDGVLDTGDNKDSDSDDEVNGEQKGKNVKNEGKTQNDEEGDGEEEKNDAEESDDDDDDDDGDGDGDEEEDEEDNFSDLKDTEDESDEESPSNKPEPSQNENLTPVKDQGKEGSKAFDEQTEMDASEKAKAMEAARNELPYTFEIPKDYEAFETLMKNYDPHFQAVIIERMIKCNHPSLKEEHKEDLDMLYTYLLQHLQDCAADDSTKVNCFKILDGLAPWLYDLTQWNPQSCSSGLMEVIKEKYQDFLGKPKKYPSLDTLIFLKLVSILFPTSDFRHPVATPSLLFIEQTLFQCRVHSSVDLSLGLFMATLAYEYSAYAKRFVPEAIHFLYGVLRLAHSKDSPIPIKLPFEAKTMDSFDLIVSDKSKVFDVSRLSAEDLVRANNSDEFKINSLSLALNLLSRFCDFWNGEPAAILIFESFIPLLKANEFSDCLKEMVEEVSGKIDAFKKEKLRMLVLEKKKPKPLRLYEPNIEQVYSLKKYRPMGKKKAERAKLVHKYKRELKGALREIRRDRSFLAKLKYKETVKSDMERQRKVREILGSAAEQAGELRKLQRKKK